MSDVHPIRVLPDALINRIRAGEVVERPAQLVKELLENSLDAGALSIGVAIRGGGRVLARVEDDGCGMGQGDLLLSVERHATSKLEGDDLSAVSTLGFRGEALAAIGAVSKLTVETRRAGDDCGWSVTVDNGLKGDLRPCAWRKGTRISAESLFRAHPARSAFLKTDRYERALVREVVEAHALARPDVAFSLDAEGKRLFTLPATDWEGRIAAVLGDPFVENSVGFDVRAEGMSLKGRIGLPSWNGHRSVGQRLLVNGRPVRDRILSSALKEAFADVSKESIPAAVLDLRVDSALVDANAHPAKAEVRFADPAAAASLVRSAVADAIGAAGPRAAAALAALASAAAQPLAVAAADPRRLPLGRALGMALGTYVLGETTDGIVLCDIHALHERVVLEKLKAAVLGGEVPVRALPRAITVHIGERAAAILDDRAGDLARFGLAVMALDGGHIVVTGVPAMLYGIDAERLVGEIASALLEHPGADPVRDLIERLCSLFACHSAVRSGDELTTDEIDRLLREAERLPNTGTCNHGRPTAVHLPRERVAAMFGR